jgi:hypothetical protein
VLTDSALWLEDSTAKVAVIKAERERQAAANQRSTSAGSVRPFSIA